MTKAEYFHSLLNDSKMIISYPKLIDYHEQEINDTSSNLLLWVTSQLNEHVKTPKHAARAKLFMTELVGSLLEGNAFWMTENGKYDALRAYEKLEKDSRLNREVADVAELSLDMCDY